MPKAKKTKKYDDEVEDDGAMPVADLPGQPDDDTDDDFPVVQSDASEDEEDDTAYTLDGTIAVAEADMQSDIEEEKALLEKGKALLKGEEEDDDDTITFDDETDDISRWANLSDDWENVDPYDLDGDGSVDGF